MVAFRFQWCPTRVDSRQSASGFGGSYHQVQKIIQLFAFNGYTLLVEILLKQVALAIGNHGRRSADYGALNGLADKTTVAYLSHGDFIDVAATLRANLNQAIFRQLNEGFTNWLARHIETNRNFFSDNGVPGAIRQCTMSRRRIR